VKNAGFGGLWGRFVVAAAGWWEFLAVLRSG